MPNAHSLLFRRSLASLLLLVVVSACATTKEHEAAAARAVPASPLFFWKVTHEGQPGTVYLLGTVHLRDAGSATLDRAVLEQVDAADELVFEIVPDSANAAEVQAATLQLGFYPEGETLFQHVDEAERAAIEAVARTVGLPDDALARMRPWLAAITFMVLRMKVEGFSEEAGVERLLLARARAAGEKRSSSLETVEEQLRLFSSLPPVAQEQMLLDVVDDIEGQTARLQKIMDAYARGDAAALSALTFEERGQDPEADALYRAIYDERNARMVQRLTPYFAKDQQSVVAVGVGHMLGELGIPALLLGQGYVVEAVPARGLAAVLPAGSVASHPFADEELGFSAELHGEPQVSRQQVPTPGGGHANVTIVTASDGTLELSVVVNDFPAPLDGDPARVAILFDNMVARMAQQFGTLEAQERLLVQGSPAARFVASGASHKVEGVVIVRGVRMYTLLATRLGEVAEDVAAAREAAARRFLDSFRLLPSTTKPDAAHEEEEVPLGI